MTTQNLSRWIFGTILLAFCGLAQAAVPAAYYPGYVAGVGQLISAVAVADFNGDGKPDVVTVNTGSTSISVLIGNGDGTFKTNVDYTTGNTPTAVVVADFNGDGKPDIAVANLSSNTVSVFINNGDGTFQTPTTVTGIASPNSIAAADFNGDGKMDLAVASGNGNIWIVTGNGTGTFTVPAAPVTTAFTSNSNAIAVGDFNGDGKPDFAVTNAGNATVAVFLNDGTGNFPAVGQAAYSTGDTPRALVVGDFNGDGKPDLAVAHFANASPTNATVAILLNSGTNGTFLAKQDFATGTAPLSLAASDLDGDGKLDLVTANASGSVSVLLGNGNGTLKPKVDVSLGNGQLQGIAIADFNGDGKLDLAVGRQNNPNWQVQFLPGKGDGSFAQVATYAVTNNPKSIVAGDFNGDGKPDLAVANLGSNTVSILLNSGTNGTFLPKNDFNTGSTPSSVATGDFNGDGKLDLVTANNGGSTVSVLLGNGNGSFATNVDVPVGTNPSTVVVADFNGDGKLDIATANTTTVSVLLGNGDGSFQTQVVYTPTNNPVSIATGDFDGDGKPDLIIATFNGVSVLLNDGTGKFTGAAISTTVSGAPLRVAVGDFNGDGKADIVVTTGNGTGPSVLLGNGDGSFQNPTVVPVIAFGGGFVPFVVTGDFNGDGKLDFAAAITGGPSNSIAVVLGNGDGTFQPHVDYLTSQGLQTIVVGDFNGDGKLDFATANQNNLVNVLLQIVTSASNLAGSSGAMSRYDLLILLLAFSGLLLKRYGGRFLRSDRWARG